MNELEVQINLGDLSVIFFYFFHGENYVLKLLNKIKPTSPWINKVDS